VGLNGHGAAAARPRVDADASRDMLAALVETVTAPVVHRLR